MNRGITASSLGRRYLIWITLSLILGIAVGLTLPVTTDFSLLFRSCLGIAAGVLLFLLVLVSCKKQCRRHLPDLLLFWFVLLAFMFGIFRVYSFDFLQHRELKDTAGTSHQYTGVLTGNPTLSNTEKSYGFPVRILSYKTEDGNHPVSGSLMLYAPAEFSQDLTRGDTVSFTATLSTPPNAPYSGGFNIRNYLYRQNYLFQQYVKTLSKTDHGYEFGLPDQIKFLGETIRDSILSSIDQSFGEHSEESALLKGILLGVEEDFSPEQYQDFVDSGLVHIISVSGMHIFYLSGFLLFFLRKLRIPRRLIYLILFPVLFLFAAVAAFTPSVCRSTIMMLLFLLANLLQREPDTMTSLSAAALILLLINPYNLTSYSFILSFSSTLGILLFARSIQFYLKKPFRRKTADKKASAKQKPLWHKYFLDPVCSSLSMTTGSLLGMGYFGMQFFRRISWGSLLANLCLLPFASATFVLGLLNWPLSYLFPSLAKIIAGIPLQFMLWCINRIADFFSHPFFRIETPTPPASFLLPYAVFGIALYFTLEWRPKNNT